MYRIECDGNLLYDPVLAGEGYGVLSAKASKEVNRTGTLEFVLPMVNKNYGTIKKLKSVIQLFEDGKEIFRGRVLHDERDMWNSKNVYAEGDLAFLLDTAVPKYSYEGSVEGLFRFYIEEHNRSTDEWKRLEIGHVTVQSRENEQVKAGSFSRPRTFEEIEEKLLNVYGGRIRTRTANGKRYIDYIQDGETFSDQKIEFGVNLLDIKEYVEAVEVFTVLVPLGKEIKEEGTEEGERITIESVNGGKDFLVNETAVDMFGTIYKTVIYDDVETPEELLQRAEEDLSHGMELAITLEIQAVDLRLAGVDTDRIEEGDMVQVIAKPQGIDRFVPCTRIDLDITNPGGTKYVFGTNFKSLTEEQAGSEETVRKNEKIIQSAKADTAEVRKTVTEVRTGLREVRDELDRIGTVYRFKGSVQRRNDLPLFDNVPGDVWDVLDTGANYAWTLAGTWDKLSENIDLSGYVPKEEFEELEKRVEEIEKRNGV